MDGDFPVAGLERDCLAKRSLTLRPRHEAGAALQASTVDRDFGNAQGLSRSDLTDKGEGALFGTDWLRGLWEIDSLVANNEFLHCDPNLHGVDGAFQVSCFDASLEFV